MTEPRAQVAAAPALAVRSLAIRYGTVPAVAGVDLEIIHGSIVTIVGSNGAGKSSIMKAIAGLLKPASGSVRLFGEDVTGRAPDQMVARGLALVPEGRRLFSTMTVRENLEIGAYRRRDAELARDFERVLGLFPVLRERLGSPAASLSGGQQQMLAVARALMAGPRVLLLDEPTIGLSPAMVETIGELVRSIGRGGVDVLLVEQNAEMALEIADHAYILERGEIVLSGPAPALLRSDEVRRAYLGI